jgi:hypothetical protein
MLESLEQAHEARLSCDQRIAVAAFEERPPLERDGLRVFEVLLEELACEACVQPVDIV